MTEELEVEKLRALLRKALATIRELNQRDAGPSDADGVAVVGMACELPGGADSPEAFWSLLRSGEDCRRDGPASDWGRRVFAEYLAAHPELRGHARASYLQRDVMLFDPRLFNITPLEARDMDPSQRLALRLTWQALERAGYDPRRVDGRVGVYFGVIGGEYGAIARRQSALGEYIATGTLNSVVSGRISHAFDFTGPAVSVDTACSSSLVAFHLACEGIRSGDCDVAVVGGVNLLLDPSVFGALAAFGALSRDGRCRPLSGAGDGYGRGEGGGVVILKRHGLARRDRDEVLAVVRATAVNHDGTCSGLTVPNGRAQRRLLDAALERARMAPADVDYLETHGTGTRLGDPIELAAIGDVYGRGRPSQRPLRIGASKGQIGHLEAAAGVASVIKLLLCIRHGIIPGHRAPVDPRVAESLDAMKLHAAAEELRVELPFTCAASSFGFSGTNAHVILSAPTAVAREEVPADGRRHALLLSARSPAALARKCDDMAAHLEADEHLGAEDVCFTSAVGREHGPLRTYVVARDRTELRSALAAHNAGRPTVTASRLRKGGAVKLAVFAGGTFEQHASPLHVALYDRYEAFRTAFDAVAAAISRGAPELFSEGSGSAPPPTRLHVALVLAYAALWRSLGVSATIWLGEGLGLWLGAVDSGALDLERVIAELSLRADGGPGTSSLADGAHEAAVLCPVTGAFVPAQELGDAGYLTRAAAVPFDLGRSERACRAEGVHVAVSLTGAIPAGAGSGIEWISPDVSDGDPADALLAAVLRLHELGVDIDWRGFHASSRGRRVLLPTYPFDEAVYALSIEAPPQASRSTAPSRDPFEPRSVSDPSDDRMDVRFAIDEASLPELSDTHHIVHIGHYVEMLLRGLEASKGGGYGVEAIRFLTPLVVRGSTRREVRLTLERVGASSPRFVFASRTEDSEPWQVHVEGTLASKRSPDAPQARAADGPRMTGPELYEGLARRGMILGPSVRVVGDVRGDSRQVTAEFVPAAGTTGTAWASGMPPALLDGCAQLFHALMPAGVPPHAAFMVEAMEGLSFSAEAASVPARIVVTDVRLVAPKTVVGGFAVVEASGRALVSCASCRLRYFEGGIAAVLEAHAPSPNGAAVSPEELASIRAGGPEARPALEAALRRVLSQLTGLDAREIRTTDRTTELGFDSLLAAKLHRVLGVLDPQGRFPLSSLVAGVSIADVAEVVLGPPAVEPREPGPPAKRRFFEPRSRGARLRLLCLPYGGGSTLLFQGWQAAFGDQVDVCPVALPGRGERMNEPLVADVHEIATRLEEEVLEHVDCPMAVYGHSAGALIGYVLATRLRARGCAVVKHLYVGAFSSPSEERNPFFVDSMMRLRAASHGGMPDAARIAAMTDDEIARLAELLRVPASGWGDAAFARQILPILANDICLVGSFKRSTLAPIDVPITAVFGARDDRVREREMGNWKRLTTAAFQLHTLDGDHFFLHPDQRRRELLAIIAASEGLGHAG